MGRHVPDLTPFACFECRKSFRRPMEMGVEERPCPICGRPAKIMGRKFKAPRSRDLKQWEKVRILREHGFLFESLYDERGIVVAYPARLAEVPAFLEEFAHQMGKTTSTALVVRKTSRPTGQGT